MDEMNRVTRGGRKTYWLSGGFVAMLGLIAVSLTAVPGSVAASGRGGAGMHDFMQWRVEKLLARLDTSDEQKREIETILETRRQAMHELRPDREALHASMTALLTADEIDRSAIEAFRAEQVEQIAAASKLLVGSLADIAEILEPAQRVELAELLAEHREHRGSHGRHPGCRHERRGDGPGRDESE